MATFPIQSQQDSKHYTEEFEDPSISKEMDGGYTTSRPSHTRTPRRTYTTGFTNISDAEKILLDDFLKEVRGGSEGFLWSNPVSDDVVTVRIKSGSMPKAKYVGKGGVHRWDYSVFKLEEI